MSLFTWVIIRFAGSCSLSLGRLLPGLAGERNAAAARKQRLYPRGACQGARRDRRWRLSDPRCGIVKVRVFTTFLFCFWVAPLRVLRNLFCPAPRAMDWSTALWWHWERGVPCATQPAAPPMGVCDDPGGKILLFMLIWATACVQTESCSAQMRRTRFLGSLQGPLCTNQSFVAGAR